MIWKKYNGLFILAALFVGAFLTFSMAAAEDENKKTLEQKLSPANVAEILNNAENAVEAPAAPEPKKLENKAKSWIDARGKLYTRQLEKVQAHRRYLEDALDDAKKNEGAITAKLQELVDLYGSLEKDGLWIVDSKKAAA